MFWLSVLTDPKNRGLKDLFVAGQRPKVGCDGLAGFREAIKEAYERTKVQLCVVHLMRAAMRYVVDKDCRPVATNLKKINNAATLAEAALENFAQTWNDKYPTISSTWRAKWPDIITRFDFPVLNLAQ